MPEEPFSATVTVSAGGPPGPAGAAATVEVGTTDTGAPGTDAIVLNSGTDNAAVLDFTIPKGDKGDTGDTGEAGPAGAGSGDIIGPGTTVVANHVVFWDGTTGTLIKDSGLGLSGANTGDQTITLTGNVTGTGTGSFAATIGNDVVTYAKMQNVSATDKVLGRSTAGAGDPEEITCTAAGRALIDDADASAQRTTLGLAIGTNVQAFDSDLTAIAALTTDSFGRGLLIKTSGSDVRSYIGAGDGAFSSLTGLPTTLGGYGITDGQPLDSDLTTLAGLTATTDNFIISVSSAWASRTPAQARTTLGLVIGTDVQAFDADLSALAGLTSAADKLPYFTGSGTADVADFTSAGRALIDDADASAQRTTLGLGSLATQSGTFSGTSSGTNTGDQTITLTGNVTGSGTGSFAATIANDAVTYAKMQNVSATDMVLGRSTAGSGDVEEIACTAAGRALIDDADATAQRATLGLVIGTNVQAFDADLSTLAGLTATTDNFIVSVASAWASRTPTQVKTTLGLTVGTDVQAHDADLDTIAGLTATTDNFLVSVSSAWASRTPAQVKTTLALTNANIRTVGFTVDGAGSTISTGKAKGFFTCPFPGTIVGWNIVVDTGTCTIQTWKIATGTAKPTVANSISTSGVAISTGTAVHSTDVTDFTSATVTANDIFAFNIGTISGPTELSFNLQINTA